MNKKETIIKIIAVLGTVLVWLPILAPIFFSVIFFAKEGEIRFDFLMPAELFLLFLFGGTLLTWISLQKQLYEKIIGWTWGGAVGLVILSQVMAMVTGLASGDVEPLGWQWVVVVALLVLYTLGVVATGIEGILLLRDLFKSPTPLARSH